MSIRQFIYSLTIAFLLLVQRSYCQQSFNSAGKTSVGNNLTITQAIGQVFYSTRSNANNTIKEGVIQIIEQNDPALNIKVPFDVKLFPNPAKDKINLQSSYKNLSYKIFDIKGILVQSNDTLLDAVIPLSSLQQGVYTLMLYSNENSKVFKLIKK